MTPFEDLNKLLIYFKARVIAVDNSVITVKSYSRIPIDLNKFCISFNQTIRTSPLYTIGSNSPIETYVSSEYEYLFRRECEQDLIAELFLATESQRFKAFEKVFDKEVEDTLDP